MNSHWIPCMGKYMKICWTQDFSHSKWQVVRHHPVDSLVANLASSFWARRVEISSLYGPQHVILQ